MTEDIQLAKEQCKHLNELIKESELLIKDPEFYIDDYFSKLRNEIDLSKEQLIESIEQQYEQIINEIKEIETICKQNAKNKESNKLEQKIISTKESLNEWTEKLESKLNLDNSCADISNKSSQSINKLKYEIKECQVALLNNKKYKFNSISGKDSIFGDLITNDAQTGNLIFIFNIKLHYHY